MMQHYISLLNKYCVYPYANNEKAVLNILLQLVVFAVPINLLTKWLPFPAKHETTRLYMPTAMKL